MFRVLGLCLVSNADLALYLALALYPKAALPGPQSHAALSCSREVVAGTSTDLADVVGYIALI